MSNLTQENIDLLNNYMDEGYSQRAACKAVGIPESTYRSWRDRGKLEAFEKPLLAGTTLPPESKRKQLHGDLKGKRYIGISAQNNTYVNKEFLKTLKVCSDTLGADILVGTMSYNKNGYQSVPDEGAWYDPAISGYIKDYSIQLADDLVWCGELDILPTAVNPISGLETYTKDASGIIPHTKVSLRSMATHKDESCRMMYTTGTVTQSNYIQKKAGQKAEFHHTYGALLIEVDDDGDWFVRQLSWNGKGYIQDLDTLYHSDGRVENNVGVEAINYGDLHSEKPDLIIREATFGKGGMLDQLRPKYQLAHDTGDFKKRNHHNIKDPYFRYRMQVESDGVDTVESDIQCCVDQLELMQRSWCQTVVVESNHDLAFEKWLKESDPKYDNIWNAIYYHKCQSRVLQSIAEQDSKFSIFQWACLELGLDNSVRFLREDESFIIAGIECGNHGHLGTNGARGSIIGYSKLGRKQNIGHGHAATILDGAWMAGIKASLEQGYNKGASSWSHSDIVTYSCGKRCMVTFKSGKFRGKFI